MIIKKKVLENVVIIFLVALIIISLGRMSSPVSGGGEECYEVPIIMYHAIMENPSKSGKYVITPDILRSDIEYILDEGFTPVFMTDLINFMYSDSPLPEKPIVLTFDDGYYNNYLYAFPITEEYNVKAVFSIIGKYTAEQSKSGERQAEGYSHVSWEQLREMTESELWEVQNHTYDMHTAGKQNGLLAVEGKNPEEKNELIRKDITMLQELIKDNIGFIPNTFTYPFGSYDENTTAIVESLGFRASLSCIEGINEIYKGGDLHLLYRYNRPSSLSTKDFFAHIFNK